MLLQSWNRDKIMIKEGFDIYTGHTEITEAIKLNAYTFQIDRIIIKRNLVGGEKLRKLIAPFC